MKYRDLIEELTSIGCFFVRQGANHEIWSTPQGKHFPVPRHGNKEVPPPTERKIRKEAGLL
jgi:predicted RNA binding protein YcfA (HicA-like mRNA interferase family)